MRSKLLSFRHWGLMVAGTLLAACSSRGPSPERPAKTAEVSTVEAQTDDTSMPEKHRAAAGLPEGPCQKAVACEDVQALLRPYFMWDDKKVCFGDQDARCACAKQLGVDDHEYCNGEY